jgi:5-formyltetrahydrofolate cyclo-ligase
MDTSCDDRKVSLRAELRQMLQGIGPADHARRSSEACARFIGTAEFKQARAVMIFLPLRYEIDAQPVALAAWQDDKIVCVPLVSHEQKHMLPVRITSLARSQMSEDHLGLMTPRRAEPLPIEMLDLVVVPGLGFDATGRRIGRGGGFYDRFLAQKSFRGTTCGLAFEEQVIGEIPCREHDMPCDLIVTDRRVLRPGKRTAATGPVQP